MRAGLLLRVLVDTPVLRRATRDCKFPLVICCDGTVGPPACQVATFRPSGINCCW